MSDPRNVAFETRAESVSAQNGNVTVIRFGEDVQAVLKRFTWLAPAAAVLSLFIGFNFAATLILWDAYRAQSVNYLLVYNHQIKTEAYLAEHGVPVDKFGEPLPVPK